MKIIDPTDKKWLRDPKNQFLLELCIANNEARRGGKRGTRDEAKFEVYEFENLVFLRDSIWNRAYKPSRGTAHIIHNPVLREIFAAPYRDRNVHHWIYNNCYDWWEKHFIFDSYSCRENKGTLVGRLRLKHFMQSCLDKYGSANVLQLDIQGYFMSLNRDLLFQEVIRGLDQQFKGHHDFWKYKLLKFCWEQIIFDDPCRGVKRKGWPTEWAPLPKSKSLFYQPKGVGIVIGNLTSQLLSNIHLNLLDRYVTLDLGYKYYGRYVDDFFIVVPDEQLARLKQDVKSIEKFLKRLGLTLHPTKRKLQPASHGINFLGGVVYPTHIYPGKRLVKNFRKAVYEVNAGRRDPESIVSYLGHLQHYSADKLITKVFKEVGWTYNPKDKIRAPREALKNCRKKARGRTRANKS